MGNLMRRIRGVLKMGAVWAVAWAVPLTTLFGLLGFVIAGPGESRMAMALRLASNGLVAGVIGFATGSLFALAIAIAERKRTLSSLSTGRFAVWGVLSGSGLAAGLVALSPAAYNPSAIPYFIAVSGIFGAASAAGLLALAKRDAPAVESELGSGASDAGLLYPSTHMPERRPAEPVPAAHRRAERKGV